MYEARRFYPRYWLEQASTYPRMDAVITYLANRCHFCCGYTLLPQLISTLDKPFHLV